MSAAHAEPGWHRGRSRPFVLAGREVVFVSGGPRRCPASTPSASARSSASRGARTRSACGRCATPTSRRRSARSCDSTTASRRPTSSSPSRAASALAATASSASGRDGCSRFAAGVARIQERPVGVVDYTPDLPVTELPADDPLAALRTLHPTADGRADRRDAALHRRRRRGARLRRRLGLRADACRSRRRNPVGVPLASFIETDLVARLRPPHPHPGRDRLAAHRRPSPRGALPGRRASPLRGPRADRPSEHGGDRGPAAGRRRARHGRGRARDGGALVRHGRVHAARDVARTRGLRGRRAQRQGRDRRRRGDPGRPGTPPDAGAPGTRATEAHSTGSASTDRCARSTRARTSSSSGRRPSRSWAPARSCSCRSRATG